MTNSYNPLAKWIGFFSPCILCIRNHVHPIRDYLPKYSFPTSLLGLKVKDLNELQENEKEQMQNLPFA